MTLGELILQLQTLVKQNPEAASLLVAAEVNSHLCREVDLVMVRPSGYDPVIVSGSNETQSPAYVMLSVAGIE